MNFNNAVITGSLRTTILLFLSFITIAVFAQPQKVAVYVSGADAGICKVMGSKLSNALGASRNSQAQYEYAVIERSDDFLATIAKEQSYQRSGAVDDDQITRIGKQFGAQLVCVATVEKAFNKSLISARLVDVETAEIEGSANISCVLSSGKEVMSAGETLGKNLLKSIKAERCLTWKRATVYVTQNDVTKDFAPVLSNALVAGFTNTGRYVIVERTGQFLNQLAAEQNYQRTGAVDDKEISRLGKQFGVNYVCVVDVTDVLGDKYVSARMLDVETAEVINMFETSGSITNMEDCIGMANQITQKLSKGSYEEQRYEDSNWLVDMSLYHEYLESVPQVNVPEWFMNKQDGEYVGISLPGGDEMDAISMALMQKILASDIYITYKSKCEQDGDTVDYGRKGYIASYYFNQTDSMRRITIDINYNILELTKLPSREYICRITDGHRNKLRVSLDAYRWIYSATLQKNKDEKRRNDYISDVKFAYANREFKQFIRENASNINDAVLYETEAEREFDGHKYSFVNAFGYIKGEKAGAKTIYLFPEIPLPDNSNVTQYRYAFDQRKSIAEQLMRCYIDILRKPLPKYNTNNYGGIIFGFSSVLRKKTPIVSMQYDNGELIINCQE